MQPSPEHILRRPNELGRIPVIMYHSVDDTRPIDSRGLNVSKATFRKHLAIFQKHGMYPVNMRDLRSHDSMSTIPKGMVPVVLTFDDGRKSQFVLQPDGTPHPDSAVGIFESFIRTNAPMWQKRASFYVMPQSSHNLEPFQERGMARLKLNYLVDNGYEVGNHTWSHRSLRRMNERQVSSELVRCFYGIRALCPRATMDTLCIPFGEYPRFATWRQVVKNPLRQASDMHTLVLMAWGGASYSPFDKRFDRLRVTRIGVAPNELERTIENLSRTGTWYVSGGTPGVLHVDPKLAKFTAHEYRNYVPAENHQLGR